jgi:prepilin-type N-terminal cleavage/methylation domain-containing protein
MDGQRFTVHSSRFTARKPRRVHRVSRIAFHASRFTHHVSRPPRAGFTLIEIMIVVSIMGIVLAMGVPMIYKIWHKEPMRQAISDVVEVCSNARARAILQGHTVNVLFHPRDRRLEIEGVGGTAAGKGQVQVGLTPGAGGGTSAHLSDRIIIEMLDVNLTEYKDEESARVRFFPNGTCDELTLIFHSDKEWKKITFEITTSLAIVGDVR